MSRRSHRDVSPGRRTDERCGCLLGSARSAPAASKSMTHPFMIPISITVACKVCLSREASRPIDEVDRRARVRLAHAGPRHPTDRATGRGIAMSSRRKRAGVLIRRSGRRSPLAPGPRYRLRRRRFETGSPWSPSAWLGPGPAGPLPGLTRPQAFLGEPQAAIVFARPAVQRAADWMHRAATAFQSRRVGRYQGVRSRPRAPGRRRAAAQALLPRSRPIRYVQATTAACAAISSA